MLIIIHKICSSVRHSYWVSANIYLSYPIFLQVISLINTLTTLFYRNTARKAIVIFIKYLLFYYYLLIYLINKYIANTNISKIIGWNIATMALKYTIFN